MAQLSRPFQIALGAVLLLALVGVIAMRAHSSNPSSPAPASAPAPSVAATSANAPGGPTHKRTDPQARAHKAPTHTAATRAHTTVARPKAVHRTVTSHGHTTTVTTHKTTVITHKTTVITHKRTRTTVAKVHTTASTHKTTARAHAPVRPSASKRPAQQVAVEGELAQGKTVLLVFWNPKSSVDREVNAQASKLASGSKGTVAVHSALADQVDEFGSITEVAHVYQTPTILIVNRHGVVSTLTGLTEVFALQQAVREAQNANH
jgi:hypothetical protein